MRMLIARGAWLPALFVMAGCGFFQTPERTQEEVVEDTTTRLGDKTHLSLAELLAQPRSELAQLAIDKEEAVARLQDFSRNNAEAVDLLPKLHLSARVPVFQKAAFSEKAGFSLPPYLAEGQKDIPVALHLARYGDVEAALKLVGPTDEALVAKINHLDTDKNYPVEWTRLVALAFFEAEFKLAGGDVDAATDLAQLHKQLQEILTEKARAGALGAALLPLAKRALTQASSQWRTDRYKKSVLADDVTAAVASWGEFPAPTAGLVPGAPKSEVLGFLGVPATGLAVTARGPAVARGLDLLELPVVSEGVEALVAFLDDKSQLAQLLLVYRPRINLDFPEPCDLAQGLEESGLAGDKPAQSEGLLQQSFKAAGSTYDVNLFTRTTRLGAFIRVSDPNGPAPVTHLPQSARNLGAVQLDLSFDQNRLAVRPDGQGPTLEIDRPAVLAKVVSLLKDPLPATLVLQRLPHQNLIDSMTLHWAADNNSALLAKFLPVLWSDFGAGRFEPVADDAGGHFDFVWQGDTTRYTLRLPNDDQLGSDLVIADSRGAQGLQTRLAAVAANEKTARKARLDAGKAQRRLPRVLHLQDIKLGMPRAQALPLLPRGKMTRQLPLADGVSLMFLNAVDGSATHSPRQMFVRFGPDDKVAEIRVRYHLGPRQPDKDHKSLLDILKTGASGTPDSLPAPWAKLWTDLPPQKPAAELLYWADDATVMTYQRDAGGAEVTLLDCDLDHPRGVPMSPLQFISRGIEACQLGDYKADILKRWRIDNPHTTADGALYFGQPDTSPYDMVLVWFENDKASRIVARHKLPGGKQLRMEQVVPALQEVWAQDLDHLGQLRRHNGAWGQVYGTYGWNDDKTRVVAHVQDTEPDGLRLFTEWREWPLPEKSVAVSPQ